MEGIERSSEGLTFTENYRRTDKILAAVKAERKRQRKKWGTQTHSIDRWLVILGEEYGEACHDAFSVGHKRDDNQYVTRAGCRYLKKELIQVAAVAVAIASGIPE